VGIDKLTKCLAILSLTLLIACLLLPGSSFARTEARYELRTLGTVIGMDLYSSKSQQCLFHQQAVNISDSEKLGVDFPAFALAPTVLGPTVADGGGVTADGVGLGTGSSANVIPFGPVNLAFPSIRQTVDQTYTASDTGFYYANFLGFMTPNNGAYPLSSGSSAFTSPISPPPTIAGPTSPYSEMYNIMPGYDRQKAIGKKLAANAAQNGSSYKAAIKNSTLLGQGIVDLPANSSVVRAQQAGNETSLTISGQEVIGAETAVPRNYTGFDTSGANMSYPYFAFNAKAGQISNTSMLDRMWRNAHLGTMGRAYEGDTSYPIEILPTEYTKSAIAMYNWYQVSSDALNLTAPGTRLVPRFWGLGLANSQNPAYGIVPGMMDQVASGITPGNAITTAGNRSTIKQPASVTANNKTFMDIQPILKNSKNLTAQGNNTTATGNNTTAVQAQKPADVIKPYMPAGGPAGSGPGWDFAGPKEKAWLGGLNNPWVTGPSNNIYFAGRGGPDWPPFYWGFGRYKGY
jgi:hypothetical protein